MSENSNHPNDRRYHVAHDWAQIDGDIATFGVTFHAQAALGDIVYYAPPEIGSVIHAGQSYGELESVKAVSDIVAPLSGEVIEINEAVVGAPESVNENPNASWLVRVRVSDQSQYDELLQADAYVASL